MTHAIDSPLGLRAAMQATNMYFPAAATMVPWLLFGTVIMMTVDFEEGAADAGATSPQPCPKMAPVKEVAI